MYDQLQLAGEIIMIVIGSLWVMFELIEMFSHIADIQEENDAATN